MEYKKNYSKIILFALLGLSCYTFAGNIDVNNLRIGAKVNGNLIVSDTVTLKDSDKCTFYLVDGSGNKAEIPSSWNMRWNLNMKGIHIHDTSLPINSTDSKEAILDVKPKFMDKEFAIWETGGEGYSTHATITCNGNDLDNFNYKLHVYFDVLPQKPELKIVKQIIRTDESGSYPVTTLWLMAKKFDWGYVRVTDPTAGGGSYTAYSIDTDSIMPLLIDIDFGYEMSGYRFYIINTYGAMCGDWIYPDSSITDVNVEETKNAINIMANDGFCSISSEETMKNINIYDAEGRLCLAEKDKSDCAIPLNKGLYIVNIITDKGKRINKKLIIK
jgi:hypothetical protein